MPLDVVEKDEAGNVLATYKQARSKTSGTRVEMLLPKNQKPVWQQLLDVFLPAGYPHSVTEDYTPYQIYDSLQAFSSSIASLLASRAVLEGVGVGDSTASPTAALLLSIVQESAGRLATILFAHRLGTALEPECKMYRLAADVFNDAAMVLDCLSPVFPKPVRVSILSTSSVLRSLCGVAAGSAKASLSAHFARWGNLGELNAKDGSQETVISLVGMLVGSIVVSRVTSKTATWVTLLFLLTVHLFMNYMAVRAVTMRSLNRQRANIVLSCLIEQDKVLSPQQASLQERIFERDGVLRDQGGRIIGKCRIGVTLQELLCDVAEGGSSEQDAVSLADILSLFEEERYLLWYNHARSEVRIVLMEQSTSRDALKAWYHALLLARHALSAGPDVSSAAALQPGAKRAAPFPRAEQKLSHVADTLKRLSERFDRDDARLRAAGWDLGTAALETRSGTRCACVDDGSEGSESAHQKQQ